MTQPLSRRNFLLVTGGAAAALGLSAGPSFATDSSENDEARRYYRLLLQHTRWVETLWDETAGHYPLADFNFVHVLGNAVLLRFGSYDAALAGVGRDVLADHTLRTIRRFAATNFWAAGVPWGSPGYNWGGRVFWDATMESYFVAAARLLWDDLPAQTRSQVDAICVGAADYVAGLGTTEDVRSGGWSSNGLKGGYRGDSKIEEMGAKSMPLATGLAYFPGHPRASVWREWLTRWMSNMTGLPSADRDNHTLLDGRPVSEWNTAQNLYESFIVENHNSYGPMYQESVGAYPGRNAVHFLLAGQRLPDVFGRQPNADELWRTLRELGTDSGLTAHPMVADRYHLYGRDVLPLTWRRLGQRDRFLARSERLLLDRLEPYLLYPPQYRLTKFSGEPKYEPEARAEVAMAYLLHRWRDRLNGDVNPVDLDRYWSEPAGVRDHGTEVGLLGHQTAASLAMVVSKPGYTKFAFVPEHDDWLLDPSGNRPAFVPSTGLAVGGRSSTVYTRAEHGFDATATVLRLTAGSAGFATLPDGAVVYASSGYAAGEGALRLHALNLPGIRGLDGNRTFHGPGGVVTLAAGAGDGGVDEVRFGTVQARHVRMLGARPATQYGYSLWSLEAFAPGGTDDLARGGTASASSSDPAFPPSYATDGQPATRWAVAREERPRPDSWLAVDLGAERTIDRVRLSWETAYGAEYRVQVSPDGSSWRDVAAVPDAHTFAGGWTNVDDRLGFVVRGGGNPIRATATSLTLSDGPAAGSAGLVIEGYPAQRASATAALAARPGPVAEPAGLSASLASRHLSLFNLGTAAAEGVVRIPPAGTTTVLYAGKQAVTGTGSAVTVVVPAGQAAVLPPLFETTGDTGFTAEAVDRRTVTLTSTTDTVNLGIRCLTTGETRPVVVPTGRTVTVRFR